MNKSRPAPAHTPQPQQPRERGEATQDGRELQPPPTGGNRHGSPAAPVMKESAKTKTESTGRS